MQTIYDQIFAFVITVFIGFLAGFLYDIYRVIRGLWKPRKLGTYIGDILFWLNLTWIVFFLLLLGNGGEIRIYVFLGIALGLGSYIKFFSKKGQFVIKKVIIFLMKIFNLFWKIISWPFKFVYKLLIIPLGLIVSPLLYLKNTVYKIIKKNPKDRK